MKLRVAFMVVLASIAFARLPGAYADWRAADALGDLARLESLAAVDGYVQILAKRSLAGSPALPLQKRLDYAAEVAAFDDRRQDWLALAELQEKAGETAEAVSSYARALPLAGAARALAGLAAGGDTAAMAALYAGGEYKTLLAALPAQEVSWRARALSRLGRYREALPYYRRWAGESEQGRWGLAELLLKLRDYQQAAALYKTLPGAAAKRGLGEALQQLGELQQAAAVYSLADEAGKWRAAGLYEKLGRPENALALYRQVAAGDSPYADDAELRLWVLARRLGLGDLQKQAYAGLSGGLAVLVGKHWPRLPAPSGRAVVISPPQAPLVRDLVRAGEKEWAWGEARWWVRKSGGEDSRRSFAALLEDLGLWGRALRLLRGVRLSSRSDWISYYPRAWRSQVEAAAREFGLEPELLYAVIWVESRFDPEAQSPTGAKGLMQFTQATWREVARRLGLGDAGPKDPQAAIRAGAYYLAKQLSRCHGLLVCALSSYNGGPGYTRRALDAAGGDVWDFMRFQPRDEPREYVERVLRLYAIYKALY